MTTVSMPLGTQAHIVYKFVITGRIKLISINKEWDSN